MGLRIGERIVDYEVTGMLGSGGMGAVYRVRHLISDRIEAMKVLLPDFESNPDLAERFIREIRLQASLSHPNIAALHTALRFDNQLLMVMEFVDGQTLGDILRRGALNQLQSIQFTMQVLSALEYAHARDIVHRDVKPSNIMITPEGVAKLMDFGIARGVEDFGRLTQAGVTIGSMYYMSPEQMLGEDVDGRSDLYATGVTLFEALTGSLPIRGSAPREVLDAHLQLTPPDPASLNPSISRELSAVVLKALKKERANRYQTASAFREDLAGALQSLLAKESLATEPDRHYPPKAERTPLSGTPVPVSSRGISQTAPSAFEFDPIGLERARKELAKHIGPVAKLILERAAKRSRTWQELYSQLAPEIPAGKERNRFLASCPKS